jgi:hypothetical protein
MSHWRIRSKSPDVVCTKKWHFREPQKVFLAAEWRGCASTVTGPTEKFHPRTVSKTVLNVSIGQRPRISKVRQTQAGMHFDVGATRRDRTGDLLITNQPLYQLS